MCAASWANCQVSAGVATPVTIYWCRVEGQGKAVDVALVRWPAGQRCQESLWMILEGFEGFEAWQTARLNASKKLLMSPWRPRKSCWCGLGALACGVRGAKKAFGGFWKVWKGLKPGKRHAWAPVKSYWCRLGALACGSGVPKKPLEGFGRFGRVWSLANGTLERQ